MAGDRGLALVVIGLIGFVVYSRIGSQPQQLAERLADQQWSIEAGAQSQPAFNSLSLFTVPPAMQQKTDLWIPKEDEPSSVSLTATTQEGLDSAIEDPIADSQR